MTVLSCSCIQQNNPADNTPADNMKALWTTLDERYCFFDEKGLDWDSVYQVYDEKTKNMASDDERGLFDTLAEMVNCLRDGHVNLYSPFEVSNYSGFYDVYPRNFNSTLLYSRYLHNYHTAGSLIYDIIDDQYGYMRCESFSKNFNELNLYYIMTYLFRDNSCKGLIIDVRNNGGGSIENALYLASLFFKTDTTAVYMQHKTGKAHNAFSNPEPLLIDKKKHSPSFVDVPIAVLTNRLCYSATNLFVAAMKNCDNCVVVGDKTGGGGGIPLSYEIPNGWMIRFSSVKMTDLNNLSIEDGIMPDVKIDMKSADVDDIIEEAKKQIDSFSK